MGLARNIEILVRRRRRRVARPFRGLELRSMISIIIHVTYFLQRWRIYAVVSCYYLNIFVYWILLKLMPAFRFVVTMRNLHELYSAVLRRAKAQKQRQV